MSNKPDPSTDPQQTSKDVSGSCGCIGALSIIIISALFYLSFCSGSFKLMPGEANLITDALQVTFDEIDQILPDSLILDGEPDPRNFYSQGESFGNYFYGLNPVLPVMAKADTSRKYRFQYVARVDHVDADQFVIRTFVVDSIWRYEPFRYDDSNPFTSDE